MHYHDRLDSLIKYHCQHLNWPLDWLLIKAQIHQESRFNHHSVSPAGAIGLMQLMPATAANMNMNPASLEENLMGGITYLKQQFDHFPEITDTEERIKFALASYNGGRGYVNAAIRMARQKSGDDRWKTWAYTAIFLLHVKVKGKRADYSQMVSYVSDILKQYAWYKSNHKKTIK